MIILDTNAISELLRPAPEPKVERWLSAQDGLNVYLTSISEAVLRYGLAIMGNGKRRAAARRRFVVDGQVVSGAGRGTGLGFPTANLRTWPRLLLPGNGIYACRAEFKKHWYTAAISVGTNPTFGTEPLHVEAYLLDFDGDVRGEHLGVEFWERLRDEEKYESPDALVDQIDDDVQRTRAIVG